MKLKFFCSSRQHLPNLNLCYFSVLESRFGISFESQISMQYCKFQMRSFTSTLISSNHLLIVLQLTLHRIAHVQIGVLKNKVFQVQASVVWKISWKFSSRFPSIGAKALHQQAFRRTKNEKDMHIMLTKCSNFALLNNGTNSKHRKMLVICTICTLITFFWDAFIGGSFGVVKNSFYVCIWKA